MISYFTVILLCCSDVNCVSSPINNLDVDSPSTLILNDETANTELDTDMNQNKIIEETGSKITVIDRQAVRDIVEISHQCTLTKYVSFTTFLIVQDLWYFKKNIYEAITDMKHYPEMDIQTIFTDERFPEVLKHSNYWHKYYLDYDFKFVSGNFQLLSKHQSLLWTYKEIYNFLAGMMEKKLGLKIKYKIYPRVIKTKFTNEHAQPFVDTINELICVLNEAIQMFDNFILEKCEQHDGNFVTIFESLNTGGTGDFKRLLRDFDGMKDRGEIEGLYRDFTKSIRGKSPAIDEIKGSGCFVENLELELSGLQMDLANTKNSTETYGHNLDERTSEIKIKLVENFGMKSRDGIKVGMILFRDEEHFSAADPLPTSKNNRCWCTIS